MFTLNLIVSKRKKKNHLQQQSKKEHLLTKNNKIMKKLYITLSIMLITIFAVICNAQNNIPAHWVSGTHAGHDYADLGLPSGTLWAT